MTDHASLHITPIERLARIAIAAMESGSIERRAELYAEAADHIITDPVLADDCRATAIHLKELDNLQTRLKLSA